MRVLIVVSVAAEKQAVIESLQDDGRFDVCVAGVGCVAAASSTSALLAGKQYDLVINLGIAGGFVGRADIGTVVVADRMVAADLGAETAEGFISLEQLQLGDSQIASDEKLADRVLQALVRKSIPVQRAAILTLSTVTGTEETAVKLSNRMPDAVAEAMEGYGVAVAAVQHNLPVLEIRAISNAIGKRDRSSWRIAEALDRLREVSLVLKEVV